MMRRETRSAADEVPHNAADAPGELGSAQGLLSRGFVTLFLVLLCCPLVLMPLVGESSSASEKRERAPLPQLTTEGTLNTDYLSQLGRWFEDRFAFRSQLIDLDATWRESLFKTSATQNVIVGTEGWLYYQGTLADYQRTAPLSDRALENIAYNLALEQKCLEAMGKRFCVTIAPNKATLYPQHLPYYVRAGEGPSNLERLVPLLEARGVTYVDLETALLQQGGELYLARDSHWSNAGAQVAYQALLAALDREPLDLSGQMVCEGHVGDLEAMLHPSHERSEADEHPAAVEQFAYEGDVTSVEDALIRTTSTAPGATGSLMVYRDSFGNTLLPYLASTYAQATFTKMVPYDMTDQTLEDVDDVVVERVERHLASFASDPPYLAAPAYGQVTAEVVSADDARAAGVSLRLSTNGPYLIAEGDVGEANATAGALSVAVSMADGSLCAFEPFHVSPAVEGTADTAASGEQAAERLITTDYGYRACIPLTALGDQRTVHVQVLVNNGDGALVAVAEDTLDRGE